MSLLRRIGALFSDWTVIRNRPTAIESAVISAVCIALAVGIWYIVTAGPVEERIVNPITLPSLADTLHSFHRLWFDRELARGTVASLGRVLGGFLLAVSIAVPLRGVRGFLLALELVYATALNLWPQYPYRRAHTAHAHVVWP